MITSGDFINLLDQSGQLPKLLPNASPHTNSGVVDTQGTTVIALKFKDGVLNVGDRRATGGNAILYDRAEKILPLDDTTLIAIAGSYARALEAVRLLQHQFKYFERSQLQPMSLEGKLQEVTRLLAGNVAAAMQGIGGFIPVLSAFDREKNEGRIFFYDGMGARFESREFGAQGSGSERIRGVFDYIIRTKGPFSEMSLDEALVESFTLLEIASELDSATGGLAKVPPMAKVITAEGIATVEAAKVEEIVAQVSRD